MCVYLEINVATRRQYTCPAKVSAIEIVVVKILTFSTRTSLFNLLYVSTFKVCVM